MARGSLDFKARSSLTDVSETLQIFLFRFSSHLEPAFDDRPRRRERARARSATGRGCPPRRRSGACAGGQGPSWCRARTASSHRRACRAGGRWWPCRWTAWAGAVVSESAMHDACGRGAIVEQRAPNLVTGDISDRPARCRASSRGREVHALAAADWRAAALPRRVVPAAPGRPLRRRGAQAGASRSSRPHEDRRGCSRAASVASTNRSSRLPGPSATRLSRAGNGSAGSPSIAITVARVAVEPHGQQPIARRVEQPQPHALVRFHRDVERGQAVDGEVRGAARIEPSIGAERPGIEDQRDVAIDVDGLRLVDDQQAVERAIFEEGEACGTRTCRHPAARSDSRNCPRARPPSGSAPARRPWRSARARRANGPSMSASSSLTSRTMSLFAALDPQHRPREPPLKATDRRRLRPPRPQLDGAAAGTDDAKPVRLGDRAQWRGRNGAHRPRVPRTRLDTNRRENRIVSLGTGAGRGTRPLRGRARRQAALPSIFGCPLLWCAAAIA